MTNEKDREEAEKLFESFDSKVYEYLRDDKHQHVSGNRIKPLFVEMAMLGYSRIRDEAVKAEREALDEILSKMSLLSSAIDAHDWNIVEIVWDDVMDAIESTLPTAISPGQGTDEKEAKNG